MSQELTSNMERAPQRALLKASGLGDDEIAKPLVAIVTAGSETASGSLLERVAYAVKTGIYANGCTPIVVPVIGVCDGLVFGSGSRYALPSREIIADSVETALIARAFDGAVFVPDSDETVAGMLMGAARVNIPSVFVSGGPMASGIFRGKRVGLKDVYAGIAAVKNGSMSRDELDELEAVACPGYGSDSGLSTANILNCACEAIGIALPGNGTALAASSERLRIAKRSGEAITRLVREAVTPRTMLTKRALGNALTLVMALGGSTDCVLHLLAVAAECNVALDLELVQQVSDATPTLCDGFDGSFDMERFAVSGGVPAMLHELAKKNLIDGSAFTACGGRLSDVYEHAHVTDETVIRKIDKPVSPVGGVAVVKGNLAERGALVKRSTASAALSAISGKAKCFNSEEDAVTAISSGKIKKGDVVVIRYEGPVGGPGMRKMRNAAIALIGEGLENDVAIVTDGRLSDAVKCTAVGHVSPEAAEGSKLALVQDNDVIKLDVQNGRLTLDVPAKTLDARRKKLRPRDSVASGLMLRYQNLVTSAELGAVLKKKF